MEEGSTCTVTQPLDGLAQWLNDQAPARSSRTTVTMLGGLRFAFYGRISTPGYQDEKSSHQWQRENAGDRGSCWQDALVDDAPLTNSWWPQYCGPVYAFTELHGMDEHIRPESELTDCERYDLSSDELRGLKGILGRQYDRVSVYRLSTDQLDGWNYPIPAVFADWNGRAIDSRKMSIGELWVHYLLWSLREMENGSLALIDEPESHISGRGQRALMDELARYCLKKKPPTDRRNALSGDSLTHPTAKYANVRPV